MSYLGNALLIILLVCVIFIAPGVCLLCVNYLAEAGGSDFHIDHTFKTYIATFGLLCLFSGTKTNG
jgi:hypothetical protein